MEGDRAEQALGRIEAALARLEAAAGRVSSQSRELEARHERLRGAVTEALAQLDAMIASRPA
jgi:hypothetical protein